MAHACLPDRYQKLSFSLLCLHSLLQQQNPVFENLTCQQKVKWSRYRPRVAQRVGRGIALLYHDRGSRRGWVVSVTPRPHFTPGKDPVPILEEAGWAPGLVWTVGKSCPRRDSIPDSPAHSHSLYRLSYPAHHLSTKPLHNSDIHKGDKAHFKYSGLFSVCGTGGWGNVCEFCGRNGFPTAPRLFRHGVA